jgi:hypothetical protein
MKLNGTHQLLAYADDVGLMGDNAVSAPECKSKLGHKNSKQMV